MATETKALMAAAAAALSSSVWCCCSGPISRSFSSRHHSRILLVPSSSDGSGRAGAAQAAAGSPAVSQAEVETQPGGALACPTNICVACNGRRANRESSDGNSGSMRECLRTPSLAVRQPAKASSEETRACPSDIVFYWAKLALELAAAAAAEQRKPASVRALP